MKVTQYTDNKYTDCVTDVILPETGNFVLYIISITTFLVVLEVFT